jgi:hypothetical protein
VLGLILPNLSGSLCVGGRWKTCNGHRNDDDLERECRRTEKKNEQKENVKMKECEWMGRRQFQKRSALQRQPLFEKTQQTGEVAGSANHARNISHSWHSTAPLRHLGYKMSDCVISVPYRTVITVSCVSFVLSVLMAGWYIGQSTVHRNVMFGCDLIQFSYLREGRKLNGDWRKIRNK